MPAGFKIDLNPAEKDLVFLVWRLVRESRSHQETEGRGSLKCEAWNPAGPREWGKIRAATQRPRWLQASPWIRREQDRKSESLQLEGPRASESRLRSVRLPRMPLHLLLQRSRKRPGEQIAPEHQGAESIVLRGERERESKDMTENRSHA